MSRHILVTGATGKVGQTFIEALFAKGNEGDRVRALCHNRTLPESDHLSVVKGSISDRDVVKKALEGITHVVHLATCKEIPEDVMDVTVKGMFWLLEEARELEGFERFVLIGGDAGMGHFVYDHPEPVRDSQPWSPYPGCYALSKVLEECMLEQYYIQYNFKGCCLRAPWIMEKDDFKYSLSFGDDAFGGPKPAELVDDPKAEVERKSVPVYLTAKDEPLQRNFVHVDDLVEAMLVALDHPKAHQETFNIAMDEPVDYEVVGNYLKETQGMNPLPLKTPYHSTWLDNTKAKLLLGWRPKVDTKTLIDRSWSYERSSEDQRKIWYPG